MDARAARRNRRGRSGHVHIMEPAPDDPHDHPGPRGSTPSGSAAASAGALRCPARRHALPLAAAPARPPGGRAAHAALSACSGGGARDAAGVSCPGVVQPRALSTCLHAASPLLLDVARCADRLRDRCCCAARVAGDAGSVLACGGGTSSSARRGAVGAEGSPGGDGLAAQLASADAPAPTRRSQRSCAVSTAVVPCALER
jgi:hypothetical protein